MHFRRRQTELVVGAEGRANGAGRGSPQIEVSLYFRTERAGRHVLFAEVVGRKGVKVECLLTF